MRKVSVTQELEGWNALRRNLSTLRICLVAHSAIFEKLSAQSMLLRLFGALIGASGDVPTSSGVGGSYLFVAARPLIGGPPFFPVHCALRCEAADGDPKAIVLDIVPVAPRDPATALTLATGGDVAAGIRCRKSPGRRDSRWRYVGASRRAAADIRAFALAQPPRICLRDESCWTFASRVAAYALDEAG